MKNVSPLFSVVVPLFRTEKYLGDLLNSLRDQRSGQYRIEYIFVDDGSDDDSGSIAQTWLEVNSLRGSVIRQENAGVSAARNTGIEAASGDWISFPDSDDFLSSEYFYQASKALQSSSQEVVILSANVVRYDESTNLKQDRHPLKHKFSGVQREVNLDLHPTFIQTQAASAFFKRDLLNKYNTRFVPGLRVAEDATFAASYLLTAEVPLMVPLQKSVYYYRSRAAGDSAADTYRTNPDFYFGRFERGYIPLLNRCSDRGGVPQWLQNTILYDLGWLFPREMNVERKATHLTQSERKIVLDLLQQVLRHFDEEVIVNYRMTWVSPEVRALMMTLAEIPLPSVGMVRVAKNEIGSFEISYLFQGSLPHEVIRSGSRSISPRVSKTRQLDYFGQQLLFERIIRVTGEKKVSLELDGVTQRLQQANYYLGVTEAAAATVPKVSARASRGTSLSKQMMIRAASEIVCWTKISTGKTKIDKDGLKLRKKRFRALIRNIAQTPKSIQKYQNAWLIMDKIRAGNDNGEYLYDFLKRNRPDINAWFVLEKGTDEWDRLQKSGAKLIDFRSIQHRVALQHAKVVASSHLDLEIVQPIGEDFYPRRKRPWRFVYLQHGVMQHNLAHWFNTKDIDLLTTASVDEHESIVTEGSTYRLTEDTVKLTGFPRHDVVRDLASRIPFDQRPVILIAPTWRNNLFLPKTAFGAKRKLRAPFLETDYGSNWFGLLASPELKELADRHSAEIVYLPHPNLRGNMEGVEFPGHVTVIESNPNIHELMSRARVTITDYSSIFFDAALADSRIVFFQFDQDEFLNGGHTYMPGYWDYEQHGFGPIVTTVSHAAEVISQAYQGDSGSWPKLYEDRIKRTLPCVDGQSAHRIVKEIEEKFF